MLRLLFAIVSAACLYAESVTLQFLVTTDMHGNGLPWDYFQARPANRGLAKAASLIREARAKNPNTILLDVGDTIQGTPMESVQQAAVRAGKSDRPDPMMAAMNALGYRAMAVGNHEWNFGQKVLNKARDEAKFPWLSANTAATGGARKFDEAIVWEASGVKVGIFGITTPNIPVWEKPANVAGYEFRPGVETARRVVARLRAEGADVVIGLVHSGLMPESGAQNENMADAIARDVPGIDVIFFGHTHRTVQDLRVNGVLMVQPRNWAGSVARTEVELEKKDGRWRISGKRNELLPVTDQTPVDAEMARIFAPYHEETEAWLNKAVATIPAPLNTAQGRFADIALVDALHQVQLHYTKADVSFTSLFNTAIQMPAGPVTIRQLAALYLYENELYAIEGNGAMVKAALENAARYYLPCPTSACDAGPLTNTSVPGYAFDIAQGVSYDIDLSRPMGDRVVNLRYKGKPLAADQPLRIAVNSYRAGGSNGYTMFKAGKIVWESGREIRDLLIEYYSEGRALPPTPDGNWRILPEAARKVLAAESASTNERGR